MPVINGVYTKDFPALGRAPIDTDIIPIAEVANQITYKTTIGAIFNAKVFGTTGAIPKFTSGNTLGDSIITELSDKIGIDIATPNNKLSINSTDPGSGLDLQIGSTSYARFGIINPGIPGEPGVDNDCFIGSTINNDFLVRTNNIEALRIDTAQRLTIANIPNADTDTDKFLVSDGGVVKYRTGAQVLSDIGAQPSGSYVTLDTTQTITGAKTFSLDSSFNGVDIGRGGGNIVGNTRVGSGALTYNTTGSLNTAIGVNALGVNTIGSYNTALGGGAGFYVVNGFISTLNTNSNNSVYLGNQTRALNDNETNQIVIGYQTDGNGSNTVTIGNSSITDNYFKGNVRGGAFIKTGGLSSQFLKADGSVDSTAYQGAITLTTTGSSGASTLIGNTLNIPNYSPDLSGYVTLNTAQTITAAKTFTTSGGSNTLVINHSSGSGIALSITKGGNGEGIYVNKTSGSGNAVTIIGTLNATTLVKNGGTSSQFLKADGSVDSTAYGTGSVTSVAALTLGTSGTDLNSSVANGTTTPVITLNVPDASASNRGVITTGTQTIAGAKTFSVDTIVNGVNIGRGGGAIETNTRVGTSALRDNTTGVNNAAFGYLSQFNGTTASFNTSAGSSSLQSNTTGILNIAIGRHAGRYIADGATANTITNNSVFLGANTKALADNQTNQIVIGHNSTGLGSNTTVLGNTSTITTAIYGNLLLGSTTSIGSDKLQVTGTASITGDIVVNGVNIGRGGGAISTNTRVGNGALLSNTTGASNVSIGFSSLNLNTTGAQNVAVGRSALAANTIGANNISIGHSSLLNLSSGNNNTSIGSQSARYISDGTTPLTILSDSIFLGTSTKALADNQTNQIVIGYNVVGLGSNTTVLGNSSTITSAIYGNLLLGSTTSTSSDKLQITGGAKITGIITLGTAGSSFVYDSAGSLILQTGASARLTIDTSGNTTLSGTLNGTSATFTNSANSATLKLLNSGGFPAIIDLSTTTATSAARNWAIYSNGTNWGDLEFKPSSANGGDPYTTGTVALRLASTGAATFSATVATTGVVFPATQVASADPNTLDDYEEGTWTIGVSFGDASTGVTYAVNTGTYTKIGRQVTINGSLELTSKGSSTGIARITGLPFTIANTSGNYCVPSLSFDNLTFANQFQSFGVINSTTIRIAEITEAGAFSSIDDSNFSNTTNFNISLTYFV